MFTGIVKETATIASIRRQGDIVVVSIRASARWRVARGQSVLVSGICSTVSAIKGREMVFQYIPETLRKTTVRWWKKGDLVNLEQSMKLGEPIDGHLVSGHVEGVGRITAAVRERRERLFKIEASRELIVQMIPKGSIAVDGVSLTLVDVGYDWFSVALIPYTIAHTSWKMKGLGDMVNIETDMLAKYLVRQLGGAGYSDVLENIRIPVKKKRR